MALNHEQPDRCPMQVGFTPEFAARLRRSWVWTIVRTTTRTAEAIRIVSNERSARTCS